MDTHFSKENILIALGVIAAYVLYINGLSHNPPGFYNDEASIAYNAYLISSTGVDEHGVSWPIYFESLGDWKSPLYIYILAAVFKLTGPGIHAARLLSATIVFAASLLIGILSYRMTDNRRVGVVVASFCLLTPWLYEVGRLVFEVTLLPIALALFLLSLHSAHRKEVWNWRTATAVSLGLALITYSCSVGKMLGPLLAGGMIVLITRSRMRGVFLTWVLYLIMLAPALLFTLNNPEAMTSRFNMVTYIGYQGSVLETASTFFLNYLGNMHLLNFLFAGDANPRHHIQGTGSLLAVVLFLSLAGIVMILHGKRRDPWWRFMLYGLVISPVPASLTADLSHSLRLVALPVMLVLFSTPAVAWLIEKGDNSRKWKYAAVIMLALTFAHAAVFHWHHRVKGEDRVAVFYGDFPEVFEAALKSGVKPIYILEDEGLYIYAYWYGLLRGMAETDFVVLRDDLPPAGAPVICTIPPPPTGLDMLYEGNSLWSFLIHDTSEYHILSGRYHAETGKMLDAISEFEAALSHDPDNQMAYELLQGSYQKIRAD